MSIISQLKKNYSFGGLSQFVNIIQTSNSTKVGQNMWEMDLQIELDVFFGLEKILLPFLKALKRKSLVLKKKKKSSQDENKQSASDSK